MVEESQTLNKGKRAVISLSVNLKSGIIDFGLDFTRTRVFNFGLYFRHKIS